MVAALADRGPPVRAGRDEFDPQGHVALLRRVVAALDAEPVHTLVTLGPGLAGRGGDRNATVAVAASAPHARLLPHAAAVVTHAGHGSVMKALAAGIPMVCITHGRDQGDNTARVLAAGPGVRLPRRAGPDAIRQAVHRVLDDPSYRANAQRLAWALATRPGTSPTLSPMSSGSCGPRERGPQPAR